MKVTIVQRSGSVTHELADEPLAIGGDPASRRGLLPNNPGPFGAVVLARPTGHTLTTTGRTCTLNGTVVAGEVPVRAGDVLAVGECRVLFGYLELPLPATPPLDDVERALLTRIGVVGTDEHPRRVLADHWMATDEPRGTLVHQQCEGVDSKVLVTQHFVRWTETVVAAGYPPQELDFARGFLAGALVVERDEPIIACPDAGRLSPRKYVVVRALPDPRRRHAFEVVALTLAGEHGRYVVKCGELAEREELPIERDATILKRIAHPNVLELFDLAVHRDHGLGTVTPWAGTPLDAQVRAQPGVPRDELAIAIGLPLCDALGALANAGIVHTELESANVLVREDGHVTLAGFCAALAPGVSAPKPAHLARRHRRISFRHMSPEQVRGLRLTPASDLFSLAVLIAQLALGRHPLYAVASDFDTLLAIRDCNYDLPATTPLLALCRAMLVPDLADRPTLADFRAGLAALA